MPVSATVRGAWLPLTLALLYTLLNAVKPLHIDDAIYHAYATQVSEHPLAPYGFLVLSYDTPTPANHMLAPPLLPLWWGAGIRLFGPHPWLWKLWLFPFSLVLVFSLWSLLQRFAAGREAPLLMMTVFSPVLLPSLNLMTDVPALALTLGALALFARAGDRSSVALAALAGLAAGLGGEAKYTGLLAPAVLLLFAVSFRLVRLWWIAAACAVLTFGTWEGWLVFCGGESHFLYQLMHYPRGPKGALILPLFVILGCTAPVVGLLGCVALRAPRWITVAGVFLAGLGYVLTAFPLLPRKYAAGLAAGEQTANLPLADFLFAGLGAGVLLSAALGGSVALRAVLAGWWHRRPLSGGSPLLPAYPGMDRAGWFLALWFGLEVVGYFALSPFPAARRVLGLTVVMTLLLGRRVATSRAALAPTRWVWALAAGGTALGLGFYGVDLEEAFAQKDAAEQAAALVRKREPDANIWYLADFGFQFYAERAGMRHIIPQYSPGNESFDWPAPSHLCAGDYLVVPEAPLFRQNIVLPPDGVEEIDQLVVRDAIPLRCVPCFYIGDMPLRPCRGPRLIVKVLQVRSPFVPASK